MLVVTVLVSIVSEKVTETFDVIETEVFSSEGELDETVGGVVSVVVVVLSVEVEEEPPSLPPPQPITMKNDSSRTENEKRFEKLFFTTLLDIKINLSIFNTYKVFESGNSALMATNIDLLTNQKS